MCQLQMTTAKPMLIFLLVIVLSGMVLFAMSTQTLADAYVPTDTPIPPTQNLEPTITPEPTEQPQTPEVGGDEPFASSTPGDGLPLPNDGNAAPTTSLISSLSSSNLCLLGLAIALLIGVMVLVIYGVIQRMSV